MNDNAANTTVDDNIGSNDGTAQRNTSTLTGTGKINSAINFEIASTDYINLGTSSTLKPASMTVTCWVKIKTGVTSAAGLIFDDRAADAYGTTLFFYGANNTLAWYGSMTGSTWSWGIASTYQLSANTWYHIVATAKSGEQKLYVNNILESSATAAGTIYYNTGVPAILGRQMSTGSPQYLQGYLDDVRIYNRVITASERAAIYNGGSGTEKDY
jgi:hypothetical protein